MEGEKNWNSLSTPISKRVDCLILDEPTNDLDIQTINILEEKLLNFKGALIFVSHDRYFVDKIASKLIIFKGDGVVEESHQSYSDYLSIEKSIRELYSLERETKEERPKPKEVKKEQVKRKLSYREQRELELLPDRIEELEAKIDSLNRCLAEPECYKERGLNELAKELEVLNGEYDEVSERYLELLEVEEELSKYKK